MTPSPAVISWNAYYEEVHAAEGRHAVEPLRKAAVGAVIQNPFAGRDYVADLASLVDMSRDLALELGSRASRLLGVPVESYGKGAVVGLNGAQEHAVACLTTVFGNALRESIGGGKAWISSVTKVASPGTSIDIPLAFKDEVYVRAYYDSVSFCAAARPLPDELLICVGVASGPRLNERVGGMTKAEALEHLKSNQ